MRARPSASLALLIVGSLIGCSEPAEDPKPKPQDMKPAVDMRQPQPDMAEEDMTPAPDMPPDMGPLQCPEKPRCPQGTSFDEDCYCRAPLDRSCDSSADCRASERCEQFALNDKMFGVCIFDESQLTVRVCPGSPGCMEAPKPEDELLAAAVSRAITPDGFETATPEGLKPNNYMNFNPPVRDGKWNDCGYDGLCPGDEGYPGPDLGEGDGELQGAFIAGFTHGRPAQYCPQELIGCDRPECCVSKLAHDDIKVQIVVLRKGEVTVAFAVIDVVGFFKTEMDFIREDLGAAAGVDLLIMSSTHNHEAPDTVGQWGPGEAAPLRRGVDPRYLNKIRRQTVEGIREAVEKLKPAEVHVAVLNVGVDGLAVSDSRPPYIFDDNVPVVRLVNKADKSPIATMLSMGNHAEALWSDNPYISSDYFHFTREYIEQGLPAVEANGELAAKPALPGLGGVTVMFAGAVGGLINPGRGGGKTYAGELVMERGYKLADAIGQTLASHVLSAAKDNQLTKLDDTALRFATRPYLTPITNLIFQAAAFRLKLFTREIYNAKALGITNFLPDAPQVMSEVSMVRLGPLTFFTAPGEVFPESLVGGFPGKPTAQAPVVGDVEQVRVMASCDLQGLPTPDNMGMYPCLVSPTQENPPDWTMTPDPPYIYDTIPGQYPFFIGLGQDFLGYFVPPYDFEYNRGQSVPGNHYEETNAASGKLQEHWAKHLAIVTEALKD